MLRKIFRKFLKGASWQNPVLNTGFKLVDPADFAVRKARGLGDLPRFSVRVRSNGVKKQFGGQNFARFGNILADYLANYAGMVRSSRVLEIGVGCGRTAHALVRRLDDGGFTGMDIERVSIEDCQRRAVFRRKKFRFDLLDVKNDIYNPAGKFQADDYRFPYDDGAFDVIYLISVFTHMPTRDVAHYIAEIGRLLGPGGHCMVSVFLMDDGREGHVGNFAYCADDHYAVDPVTPEIATGYKLAFFEDRFAQAGMAMAHGPAFGSWRANDARAETAKFGQDLLFFRKR